MKDSRIAIVGMAGRFPGARNLSEFWQNLHDGVESIRALTEKELLAAGATPQEIADPDYVRMAAVLDDVPMFDASFFGFSPRDASIMDPQHRHFLECAWEALEDAGHVPANFNGSIGVYAGSGLNSYLIHNLLANRKLRDSAGLFQLKQTGNDKDVLSTRVSYQLDLRGPSINVQTACSTSLVAVHLACQSLLNFECDMALAGGVTIEIPHGRGYIYHDGEILSRDGHCRAFDASSSGTIFGSGLGLVVLRRLEDAIADRDNIRAIILGSAINNDGARKVGYLAPSVDGQAEVIAEALGVAGVSADDISYVETHGTGTVVGDPIEVRALTQAFRKTTQRVGYCGIGSLKTSIGHLDAAAGVANLMKTVLALQHRQLPASLNFHQINPHIELQNSPFYINNKLADWPADNRPRRAGVTSLGIGGTNAHVVLEEAAPAIHSAATQPYQVLTVSAKSESAADRALENLAAHLQAHPEVNLADAAFTCQMGRQAFQHRRAIIVPGIRNAANSPINFDRKQIVSAIASKSKLQPVFMFSGQGAQHANMARELYINDKVFRSAFDDCSRKLQQYLNLNLCDVVFPPPEKFAESKDLLDQTWLTQPALFAIEYSLAQWWISLGVNPVAMVGHSIGEYVAACLAGVFSLDDALAITAYRGRLMFDQPRGAMLAVPLPASELNLDEGLSLAAINNPEICVVSGPNELVDAYEAKLKSKSLLCTRLHTSHAFHSAMMDPVLPAFEERLKSIPLHPPRLPFLSNLTGTWITAAEATDPTYWSRHLRSTVRFSDCIHQLLQQPNHILIEVGPGSTLASLARLQSAGALPVLHTLPHPKENLPDHAFALRAMAQAWAAGVEIRWSALHDLNSVQRVPMPTYPFERQKFWIDPDPEAVAPAYSLASAAADVPHPDPLQSWLYQRAWQPSPIDDTLPDESGSWIIFADPAGLGERIARKLKSSRQDVVLVFAGTHYTRSKPSKYILRPEMREDYDTLLVDIMKSGRTLKKILYLWSLSQESYTRPLEDAQLMAFFSPLYLAQSLAAQDILEVDIAFVTDRLQKISDEVVRDPMQALMAGPAKVVPKELPGCTCRCIDLDLQHDRRDKSAQLLVAEMSTLRTDASVAYRKAERYVEQLVPMPPFAAAARPRIKHGGVYFITGGMGGIGMVLAEYLAREFNAKLVLTGRTQLPSPEQWTSALQNESLSQEEKQKLQSLLEIQKISGGLLAVSADVSDLDQMQQVISDAKQRFGKIDGVFHAAGVLDDGPLMLKTAESASRVLAPKVRGTLQLAQAFSSEPPDFIALFSSISAIYPPEGQVDYAAANAFLDTFAAQQGAPYITINWGAWQDVGMAARFASPHPLLDKCLLDTNREIVYSTQFSPQRQWLLAEHKLKSGLALIPGTGHMEMVSAAFTHAKQHGAIELQDVYFLSPMMFDDAQTKEVRIQLRRENRSDAANAAFHFSVYAFDKEWIEHSTGSISTCRSRPALHIDRTAIAARCKQRTIVFGDANRPRQERHFNFGPRWQTLRTLQLGEREALAEISLDSHVAGDVARMRIHPALLDMATGAALYLTDDYEHSDDLFLPISYRRIRIYRPLPAKIYSHVRARQKAQQRNEIETFDVTIFNEQGEILVEVEGFSTRRINNAEKIVESETAAHDIIHSSGDRPIEIFSRSGIQPLEGVRLLTRILQSNSPTEIVVTPLSPAELDTRSTLPSPRPADAATASPESVAATLTAWWQELLGVESISIDDDFFDLGGHSLVGVRLFAKIKKTYHLNLDLAVLFEARTIRQLTEVIQNAAAPAPDVENSWSAIVPIQTTGSRPPVFFVHHVVGDVMFYEHLARHLGSDQPFYAFRTAIGPHPEQRETSMEELAAIYVKQLIAFLPDGPYRIGGSSFGGNLAFEMARQMDALGKRPELLLLFDTFVPGSDHQVSRQQQIATFMNGLRKEGVKYFGEKLFAKSVYLWKRVLLRRAQAVACACYHRAGVDLPAKLRFYEMEEIHLQALYKYKFEPYNGKIILLRAINNPEYLSRERDPYLGWEHLAAEGVEIYDIPGGHSSMLQEPYVRNIASVLQSILR